LIETAAVFDPGSTVEVRLEPGWVSVQFADGVNPALGGTLDLEFAPGIYRESVTGQAYKLFSWDDPPSTRFDRVLTDGRFYWDLSGLYTTGVVRASYFQPVPEPTSLMIVCAAAPIFLRRGRRRSSAHRVR
jgi:hypothetical protein